MLKINVKLQYKLMEFRSINFDLVELRHIKTNFTYMNFRNCNNVHHLNDEIRIS